MFSLSKQEVISYLALRRSNSARPGQPFCLGGMTRKRALSFPTSTTTVSARDERSKQARACTPDQ
jgi:hypothetical protein